MECSGARKDEGAGWLMSPTSPKSEKQSLVNGLEGHGEKAEQLED